MFSMVGKRLRKTPDAGNTAISTKTIDSKQLQDKASTASY